MAVLRVLVGLRFVGTNRRSVLALLLVSTLATVGIVAGLSVRTGAEVRVDELYESSGQPDLILSGGPNALPLAIEKAKSAGLIDAVTIYSATFGSLQRPDGTGVGTSFVAAPDFDQVEVGAPILTSGRWPVSASELVLDTAGASVHNYDIGTVVSVVRDGVTADLTVVGTAVDLTECFYPTCTPLRGYLSPAGVTQLAVPGIPYAQAHARLAEGVAEADAARTIRTYERVSSVDTWSANREQILLAGNVFSAFVASFGIFVLLSTLLVVASTAVGAVVARRRELGLLKALGATPMQLLAATLLEQILVGLVGVLVGWALGSLLAPWLQLGLVEVFGRAEPRFDALVLVVAALVMACILSIATIAPALRTGSLSARAALADAPPASSGLSRCRGLQVLVQHLPLSPPSLLGVQLVLARPVRSLLAGTAVAVSIAAGLAGWRLSSAVTTMIEQPGHAGDPYDVLVAAPPGYSAESVVETLAGVQGVASWYSEESTTVRVNGRDVGLRGIGGRVDSAGLVLAEGAMPQASHEALAGWGLVRDGDVTVGDTLDFEFEGSETSLSIVGRHADLDHGGRALVVSMVLYEEVVGSEARHWRVAGEGSVDRASLSRRIDDAFAGRVLVRPATHLGNQLGPFQIVVAMLVVLVSLVAAANLGSTLMAGAQERRRETGVVRALGFSDAEMRRQAASSGLVVGLVGVMVGVPAGLFASAKVVELAANEIGLGPGVLHPPWLIASLVSGSVGLLLSAGVSIAAARKLRLVSTSSLVREV